MLAMLTATETPTIIQTVSTHHILEVYSYRQIRPIDHSIIWTFLSDCDYRLIHWNDKVNTNTRNKSVVCCIADSEKSNNILLRSKHNFGGQYLQLLLRYIAHYMCYKEQNWLEI